MIGIIAANRKRNLFDVDAQAFFTATGITDSVTKGAINVLVEDLKTAGLWSKLKAIYPFVGGTANTHKFNLKDPRDLDAAFRLAFTGGWTHNADGATPNGSTGYANTFFNTSIHSTSSLTSMGIYNDTNTAAGTKVDIGALSNSNRYLQIYPYFGGTYYCQINTNNSIGENTGSTFSNGWYFGSRTASNQTFFQRNETQFDGFTTAISPNANVFIGAQNNAGTPQFFSDRRYKFAVLGDSITKPEGLTLNTILNTFLANRAGAPLVNAGTDQTIVQPASGVTLSGSATDNGTISSYAWTQDSGPSCTITSPSSSSTTVTGMNTAGVYVFRLTATDNSALTGYDTVQITVSAASGAQSLTTVGGWNAWVHLPDDYDANPSTYYPTIIYFPGLGEVGTNSNLAYKYGPNAHIKDNGWDGNVVIDATTVKFIVITLQPSSAYPPETSINSRLATLKSTYRIDPAKLNLTGFSHGGWCCKTFITGDALGGPFTYASQVNSVVDVQGVISDDNSPYPDLFDNVADAGIKYAGFEQAFDNRGIPTIVARMNAQVSGTALYEQTNFDGGGHGSVERWYGGYNSAGNTLRSPQTFTSIGNETIYQWMARQ